MILYHHTAVSFAEGIFVSQLNLGHVTRRAGEPLRKVVWLTTDTEYEGHGLTTGEELGEIHLPYVEKVEQTKLRQGKVSTADKTRIRIKMKIPTRDRDLVKYSVWSRKHDGPGFAKLMGLSCVRNVVGLSPAELDRLMSVTPTKEGTWFLAFRAIDPSEFEEVLYRTAEGYVPYNFEQHGRAELEKVGIYAPDKSSLDELRGLLHPRHGYDLANAVVTCADPRMPANVVVRGGGMAAAYNLTTRQVLEGDPGPYGQEIAAWVDRHAQDLMRSWEKSRAQLENYQSA